ncbi:hypothetical protein [Bdellovibrio bacteriovorus]|uniref:hypothetical protein n=1 Tax=Bdellovibrio bacteriovorus TaxID=959 RepID=UPI003CFC0ABC
MNMLVNVKQSKFRYNDFKDLYNLGRSGELQHAALNAMTKEDLRAMYRFVKSLGPSANKVPVGLLPGEVPRGPYMDMTVVMPK